MYLYHFDNFFDFSPYGGLKKFKKPFRDRCWASLGLTPVYILKNEG
jgi:hypothetical protein